MSKAAPTMIGIQLPDVDVWSDTYVCCGGGNGTRSGTDGTYTITGLAPDDYRVQVDATRLGYTRQFFSSTADWDRSLRVTVAAGTTTQPVESHHELGCQIVMNRHVEPGAALGTTTSRSVTDGLRDFTLGFNLYRRLR